MKDVNTIRNKIIDEYRKAFAAGTDQAWNKYYKFLSKLAKDIDASSTAALEDWAFNTARQLEVYR